jgi:hypothetical protein
MRRIETPRGAAAVALASLFAFLGPGYVARGQDDQGKSSPPVKSETKTEKASGVLLKVEKISTGNSEGAALEKRSHIGQSRLRLVINTNAVWRDWARDQARVQDPGSPRTDADKGRSSIATKGEPADANGLVVVDLVPETRIETRFRAPDDESSRGSKTPDAAREYDRPASKDARGVTFGPDDLKSGLYVEVEYRHVTARNPASVVTVVRPISGGDVRNKDGK